MADITMCNGTGCQVKDACYRYTAPVNEHRQSYFIDMPLYYDHDTGMESCDHFWEKQLFNLNEGYEYKQRGSIAQPKQGNGNV